MRSMIARRHSWWYAPRLGMALLILPLSPAGAQDEVVVASASDVQAGTTVVLELGVRDRPGTLLGADAPVERAIQNLALTVRWSPAIAVSGVNFRPAGLATGLKRRFEQTVDGVATASWIIAFEHPLPLTLGGLESIGELEVRVAGSVVPGSAIDLDLIPTTTALGNGNGSDVETVANGELHLVCGTILVGEGIFADGFETGSTILWSDSVP